MPAAVPIFERSAASAMLRPSRRRGVTRGTHIIRRLARNTMWCCGRKKKTMSKTPASQKTGVKAA